MKTKTCYLCFGAKVLLILAMYAAGIYFYNDLPDLMPTHWGFDGRADGFSNKWNALFLFPLISVAMLPLFSILKKIDPKKDKYTDFRKSWEVIQIAIIAFFTYIYYVMIYAALDPSVNVGKWIVSGIGILFALMGFHMIDVKQNYFIGFKTPWTLSNEKVWDKTQKVGGVSFIVAGCLLFVEGLIFELVVPVFIVVLLAMIMVPFVYSYFCFRSLSKAAKDNAGK